MSRSESNNSFSHGPRSDRANQSNVQQMQQEADQYTRKYEWERRNLITIEAAVNTLEAEILSTKNSVAKLKRECEEGDMKVTFTKMRNLQKQIDSYDKRYNDTIGDIDRVKTEINALRQERIMYKGNLESIENDIQQADAELDKVYQDIEDEHNQSKTSQNVMLNLKMKNEEDRTNYYKQLNNLNQELRDKRQNVASRVKTGEAKTFQTDTATVLKRRLTKLIVNNKEKVRLIDNYQRNMKIIDEAFNTIKEATGLTDIEQIQNIFIKGEQQNYGLLTYVDVLNQEIDKLEDINLHLREKNDATKIDITEKHRIFNGTPDDEKKRKKITVLIDQKKVEIGKFEALLTSLEPRFQQVLVKLAKSKLNSGDPNLAQEYETNGINLNESSLDQYLSDLEQYTNKILFAKAKAANESTSDTLAKTLLLDELPSKDKRKIQDNLITTTEDGVVNAKELLDKNRLDEMANREIEKFKSAPEKEKARLIQSKKP